MNHTLLLRLVGPLQAWDVQSHFTTRTTGLEPSKSGVVGLLCAAMGYDRTRDDDMQKIATLKMGVRVDREGLVRRDFHTAGKDGYLTAGGKVASDNVIVSERWYLVDAAFLIGLEGDDDQIDLLRRLHEHLQNPVWLLFLGRKACVPGEPIDLPNGLRLNEDLQVALGHYARLRNKRHKNDPDNMRGLIEDEAGEIIRPDQPLSFRRNARKFGLRRMRSVWFDDQLLLEDVLCTSPVSS